jgi:iron complex transport system ATP-binding protein
MKAVATRALGVAYGDRQILHQVDLTVEPGSFLVIIGPNGTGKTSLLKALAGLIPASGGIEILGRPLADYSRRQLARQLAMVAQHASSDFPFTVAETVLMGRSPHLGLLESEGEHDLELARQAMAFTDVAHLAGRRLEALSGGERQRVIIARAICQQPRLILLDEPTASLDPAHQVRIMDLLERLRREQGVTVIMVSHDLNLAAMYGEQLALMHDGRIALLGSPEAVLTEAGLSACYGCAMEVCRTAPAGPLRVFPVPGSRGGEF